MKSDIKSNISILLLSAIAFIAVFGVFSMTGTMAHGSGCWATSANGIDCPENMNPIASINFHIDAIEKFSLATLQDTFSLTLLLVVLLFISARMFLLKEVSILNRIRSRFHFLRTIFKLYRLKFTRWLSLLENSPSLT